MIVNLLPSQMINASNLNIPDHIRSNLADPQFNIPGSIDLLIGTELFFEVLGIDKWPLTESSSFHSTEFGWIVIGKLPVMSCTPALSTLTTTGNSSLSLFVSKAARQISEEQRAEEYFCSIVSRIELGHFVVRLPFTQ